MSLLERLIASTYWHEVAHLQSLLYLRFVNDSVGKITLQIYFITSYPILPGLPFVSGSVHSLYLSLYCSLVGGVLWPEVWPAVCRWCDPSADWSGLQMSARRLRWGLAPLNLRPWFSAGKNVEGSPRDRMEVRHKVEEFKYMYFVVGVK